MTTAAIGSSASPTLVSQNASPLAGVRQDFRSLETALLNGDVSGAQSTFASLQQAVSDAPASANPNSIVGQLGQSDSTLGQGLQAVSTALDANDIGGAQKAFASLQQDIEAARQSGGSGHVHHGHHGHHAKSSEGAAEGVAAPGAAATGDSQSTDSTSNDLLSVLQSLASANPKVAADLGTLVGDLANIGKVVNTTA